MKRFFTRLIDYFALKSSSKNRYNNSIKAVLKKIIWFSIILTIILLTSIFIFFQNNSSYTLLNILSIIGAYYLSGSAVGFIFAIPKSAQNTTSIKLAQSADGKEVATPAYYNDNTNLEEISDWLTKIIIGLSLTQFEKLQKMIESAALKIDSTFKGAVNCIDGCGDFDFFAFAYSSIILYSASGLITGYLWTRIEFPKILTQYREEVRKMLNYKEVSDNLLRKLNNPNNPDVEFTELKKIEESKNSEKIEIINKIVHKKPKSSYTDDIQKNRWGGNTISNNRKLSAEVYVSSIPSLYKVKIIVSSLDGSPLGGSVGFMLHDSFDPMIRIVEPANNAADVFIEVIAYEAFTVGAVCDIKSETEYTQLELDLNQLYNLPQGFYWK